MPFFRSLAWRPLIFSWTLLFVIAPSAPSEEPVKERLREKIRERVENLPPAEREKFIETTRRRAKARLDREATASLPQDLTSTPVHTVAGRTLLPLIENAPQGEMITVQEVNRLFEKGMGALPAVKDDLFVRRVYLDIVGQLPAPADIEAYLADKSPDRKVQLVNRLLELPQYGRHWGKYWSDVVRYRATNEKFARYGNVGEVEWLAEKLNANERWSEIVTSMLTAEGIIPDVPEAFFIACHDGDAAEVTGEVARIFLGTQINCAQCHDHPYDPWKRDQFHELASFFGRSAVRVRRDLAMASGQPFVVEVGPNLRPNSQYRKPDLSDPSKPGEIMQPVFLTGQPIPLATSDAQRRLAASELLTNPRNPAFSRAFVNRMWYELVGFGFVEPIDDMGPNRNVRMPELLEALSASFVASDTDIKRLVRTIVLSDAYDRQIAAAPSGDAPLRHSTRLAANEIFTNLDWVLGEIDDGRPSSGRRPGSRGQFERIFGVDPSTPPEDIEGSISQALLLMNHPLLEQRVKADTPGTLLNKLLATNHKPRDVVDMLYMRVMGRKPTRAESATCLAHVESSATPKEGFEDVLWSLLNSAEFIHQH